MGQPVTAPEKGGQILRSMISFGVTEKVQVSVSLPVPLVASEMLPSGRMMSMMSVQPRHRGAGRLEVPDAAGRHGCAC